ncbi:hypothetical protein V6N11_065830 [Hibiscus sabdariffa]|uniref:Uncharacterized protein n=1 Tax=Hibiscus sabdariffa TaxID=183260 RepID=A0ABR2PIT8_9ROSI
MNHGEILSYFIVGVEFEHPVVVCPSWLACKSEPAQLVQSIVYELLQSVVGQGIIEVEALLLPSALGGDYINYPPSSKEISADFQGFGRHVSNADLTASCFLAGKSDAFLQLLPTVKYLLEIFTALAGLNWADALGFSFPSSWTSPFIL